MEIDLILRSSSVSFLLSLSLSRCLCFEDDDECDERCFDDEDEWPLRTSESTFTMSSIMASADFSHTFLSLNRLKFLKLICFHIFSPPLSPSWADDCK